MTWIVTKLTPVSFPLCVRVRLLPLICAIVFFIAASGCAHYPINQPLKQVDPRAGYRGSNLTGPEKDDQLLLLLTFSGGGTRAAAFSYGVLETLRDTTVSIRGRNKRLLDEVDWISGVSGGSFTAAYYGLFRDRIFEDFEARFLKKDIEGDLIHDALLNPVNWAKFSSPYYARSDFAADYYNKNVFEGKTFADLLAKKEPMIVINATDMVYGNRFSFNQDVFDAICSDLSTFPVARACAASSAVPVVLSPITIRNHAGECGFKMPPALVQAMQPPRDLTSGRLDLANNMLPLLDSKKNPFIHLVDGGVADNLGIRAALERVTLMGDCWATLQYARRENVHKIVFVVVNAETEVNDKWNRNEKVPPISAVMESYSSIVIERYNMDTVALLSGSFPRWADEIRKGRCGSGEISREPGSCGDIEFYLVQVRFEALDDAAERSYLESLPTSFALEPEQVDKLRGAARRILTQSKEFQRLLRDLQ